MTIPEQCERRIRDKYLSKCQPSPMPRAWFMCGLPGSGKTSFLRKALKEGAIPNTAFLMDPDGIMENIEAYQTDFQALGAEAAFLKWEMPARSLGYAMLDEARIAKFDIVIDMGHALPESRFIIDSLRIEGYATTMFYINCPKEVCLERIVRRERHLPSELITQRAETLRENLLHFEKIIDCFEEIDGKKDENQH